MKDFKTLIAGIIESLELSEWGEISELSLQACSNRVRLENIVRGLHKWNGSDPPSDKELKEMKKKQIASHIAEFFFLDADKQIFKDSISKVDGEFWQKNNATLKTPFWQSLERALSGEQKAKLGSKHHLCNWDELIVVRTKDDGLLEYCLDLGNGLGPKAIKIPKIQRPTRWSERQQSDFVRSLTGGWPIPSMTLYQEDDDSPYYEVLDGQQRLSTAFSRKGQWHGKLPEDSPKVAVTLLRPADGVDNEGARRELVRIFQVLNTGGTNLKPLEVIIASYVQSDPHKALIEELLRLSKFILSDNPSNEPWMAEVKDCTKPGKPSILDSDTLTAQEIEVIDILLRPLVYGTLRKPGIIASARCSPKTTMSGIQAVIENVKSVEHAEEIRHRLARAFKVASEVFPGGGEFSFLRMPKRSKDQEAKIEWSTRSAFKTAAALQVGSIYAHLPLLGEIEEEVREEIRTAWGEFVNPGDGGENEHFLDEFYVPRSQNTTSLWGWQNFWSGKVKEILIDAGIDIAKEKPGENPTPSWSDTLSKLLPASKIESYRQDAELFEQVPDEAVREELKIKLLERLLLNKD